MNNKEKDQLEVIIAELAAISQVIYRYLNQDINQDLNQIKDQDLDQDKVKINPSAKDIDQDKIRFKNQDKVQDNNPELFPRIEQEMDIKASLNYIWTDQKMKSQVYHAVIPYADLMHRVLNRADLSTLSTQQYLDEINFLNEYVSCYNIHKGDPSGPEIVRECDRQWDKFRTDFVISIRRVYQPDNGIDYKIIDVQKVRDQRICKPGRVQMKYTASRRHEVMK